MIETDRLILRSFREGDDADVFEYLKAPMVNCFACMKLTSLEEAQKAVMERAEDAEYTFAIVLKDTGKVIGEIDAHPESSQPDMAENYVKDTFSPCWMLHPDYHGKGYAYEAAKAFFDYLFYQKGARRIYAYTEDYNLSSQHLCEKLGMRREGLFREFVSFVNDADGNPIYENTYQYAILKKEWERISMKIEYRKAGLADTELLIQIYNSAFYRDYVKYGECPAYGKTKEMMEQSIIHYPKFIILNNSEPVGCVSCKKVEAGIYEIGCLCVIPEHQGKGIGRQSIQFVKAHYEDWEKFTLVTPIDKKENVKFYTEKCGFKIVSTEMDGNVEVARFVLER